jgi:hypothetical protein
MASLAARGLAATNPHGSRLGCFSSLQSRPVRGETMGDPVHDSPDRRHTSQIAMHNQPMRRIEARDPAPHPHQRRIAISEVARKDRHTSAGSGGGSLHTRVLDARVLTDPPVV